MCVAQAIAAAQSIAARLSQQAGAGPTASAPGSYGNQPYSYDEPKFQPSSLPGPPPVPISSSTGPQSDALAAAQAVAARLSAQSGLSGNTAPRSAAPGQPLPDVSLSAQPQQPESKQEAAIRAAEAVAARFSAQVAGPPAAAPASGNPYASTYGAANGHSISQSSSHGAQPALPQDPIAAAQAVAARLAGQLSQSGQPKLAMSAQPSGRSSASDPIAAAQAVAARLAARHGDVSMGGPPSNPYGGSTGGTIAHPVDCDHLCMVSALQSAQETASPQHRDRCLRMCRNRAILLRQAERAGPSIPASPSGPAQAAMAARQLCQQCCLPTL